MAFNLKPVRIAGVTLALLGGFAAAPAHAFFPILLPLLVGGVVGADMAHSNDYWRERGYAAPPPGYYYAPPTYPGYQNQGPGGTTNYNYNRNDNTNYNEQRQRQAEEQRERQQQFQDEDDFSNSRHAEHERSHLRERDWRDLDRGHERDFESD